MYYQASKSKKKKLPNSLSRIFTFQPQIESTVPEPCFLCRRRTRQESKIKREQPFHLDFHSSSNRFDRRREEESIRNKMDGEEERDIEKRKDTKIRLQGKGKK